MDYLMMIRSLIFLTAGLALILFPEKIYRCQVALIKKVNIKCKTKNCRRSYIRIGTIFIAIAIMLFVISIS